ncbi:hypothetical protein INT47_004924 [Mucor saturninus]|uniref:Uncharacterized protein n=1 Tax=Mucor saturninus TaxID=64648 RepID=A0A8H7R274_9FUNG|nr:hypothetical protein INT47_004924 [Mucor saturninus]
MSAFNLPENHSNFSVDPFIQVAPEPYSAKVSDVRSFEANTKTLSASSNVSSKPNPVAGTSFALSNNATSKNNNVLACIHRSKFNSNTRCKLSYADIQGKKALIKKFQNSQVMEQEPSYQLKVFYSSGPLKGREQPFPRPTGDGHDRV